MKIKNYLKEMRIHHYIKNLLIFAPLACSGQLFNINKLTNVLLGFLSFCFMCSAIYFINDIQDIEKDRNHPKKCNRPIASGKISKKAAILFTLFLILLSLIFNLFIFSWLSTIILLIYFVTNVLYSKYIKNIPIIDIAIIALGFLLRTVYGSIISEIKISNWLYLVVLSVSFYFALGKRRNEFKKNSSGSSREVIKKYTYEFLNQNMYMSMTLVNIFYALWTTDETTIKAYNNDYLIWTVLLVILICMRYSLIIEGDSDGDPVDVLLKDKPLIVLCLIYLIIMFLSLYIL